MVVMDAHLGFTAQRSGNSLTGALKARLGTNKQVIVLKVGTSSLVRPERGTLNLSNLARICETIKQLSTMGHHVIVVSSGAVGVGCQRLGLSERPTELAPAQKQALAAVGQVHLMRYYEDFLSALGLTCAQVLLTLDNMSNREQHVIARNTFSELLAYGAIPVVNENDSVAGMRFGDNDTLSAKVAALVQADWLFLLTDVDCLYTSNPKENPDAQPIYEVEDISRLHADTSSKGTEWGTGGMATKLSAGRIATSAGCTMVIANSTQPEAVVAVLQGKRVGTKFHPNPRPSSNLSRNSLSRMVPSTLATGHSVSSCCSSPRAGGMLECVPAALQQQRIP